MAHVVVVVALLPESSTLAFLAIMDFPARDRYLEGLNRCRQDLKLGFGDQQVYVFRHHDVTVYPKTVGSPRPFQRFDKQIAHPQPLVFPLPSSYHLLPRSLHLKL